MKVDKNLFSEMELKILAEKKIEIDFEKDYTQDELEDIEYKVCKLPMKIDGSDLTARSKAVERIIDKLQDNYTMLK